jgi:hypothetical protein
MGIIFSLPKLKHHNRGLQGVASARKDLISFKQSLRNNALGKDKQLI